MHKEKARNVIIGTPCLDGRVDALYTYSLYETAKACAEIGINVHPVFITRESLIQRARNDLIFYAYNSDITDLIFIDSDQFWKSDDFIKLLSHDVDMVGGTYRKKTHDQEMYVLKIKEKQMKIEDNGLVEVAGLGTGFLRLSYDAIKKLNESEITAEYKADDGTARKMIFNLGIAEDGTLVGEDIYMCSLYRELGGKVFLDPDITIGHVGSTNFGGNFKEWSLKNNLIQE